MYAQVFRAEVFNLLSKDSEKKYIYIIVVRLGMYNLILIMKCGEQKCIFSFKENLVALALGRAVKRQSPASSH